MSKQSDIKILELLASKICHDLISPVGAVSNGVEFLQEAGGGDDEATSLIAFSAGQASAKLQLFRLAYGAGGGDSGIKPEEVHATFENFIKADNKVRQDWDPHAALGPAERPEGFAKLLACTLMLAHDSLPKGGTITVSNGAAGQIAVRAEGVKAHPKDGTPEALAQEVTPDELEPKTIHPYTAALIAESYGAKLRLAESGDGFVLFTIDF